MAIRPLRDRYINTQILVALVTAAGAACFLCGSKPVRAGRGLQQAAKAQTDDVSPALTIPEGDAAALLKFIKDVRARPLENAKDVIRAAQALKANPEADVSDNRPFHAFMARFVAIHEAADRVLAMEPDDEQRREAVEEKFRSSIELCMSQQRTTEELRAELDVFLAASVADAVALRMVSSVGHHLETRGEVEMAGDVYRNSVTRFANTPDPDNAGRIEVLHGAVRRTDLVHTPAQIEGTLLDGSPLEWSQYKGKVVLVQFWATWCDPCVKEMPNILENYERYHDKGFEVLGISVDDKKFLVNAFVRGREIPWPILYSADPDATGTRHPMAVRYGLDYISTSILLDRSGRAVSLNAKGEELGRLLAQLFDSEPDTPAGGAGP